MEAFQALTRRHGVLRFKSTAVEPEKIKQVLRAAVAAPSAANTQPWAFVVVTQPELARRVAAYLIRTQEKYVFRRLLATPEPFIERLMHFYDEFAHAPCFIVLCRQQRVTLAPPEYAHVLRDWDLCSLGAAMANLMAAATDMGLGTRWFGNPMLDANNSALKQMLNLPDAIEVVAVTPLGYHDEPPKERPVQSLETLTGFRRGDKHKLAALLNGKLALKDIVHYNGYSDPKGERQDTGRRCARICTDFQKF
jgi:nitroreductase